MKPLPLRTLVPLLAVAALASPARDALAQGWPPPPPVAPGPPPPADAAPVPPTLLAPPPAGPGEDDHSALARDGYPLAGWHNGLFYLRDRNDEFRLYSEARAQTDFYSYFGPGVASSGMKPTFVLRRVRPELTGELARHWSFMIAGDFGTTTIDDPNGTNETYAALPGTAPSATTAKYTGAQTVSIKAAPTDVFVNYKAVPLLNVQVGQFDVPFMMENRTSDKYMPFMERSLAVRAFGVPEQKEIGLMAWGEMSSKVFAYSIGFFNGNGENKLNVDNSFDLLSRVYVSPLRGLRGAIRDAHLGASFRGGSRDASANYDYAPMSTQGTYQFWGPTYTSSQGLTHIIPSGVQNGVAGELRIPISLFDLTSEAVYIKNGTREALDGYQATNSQRFGTLSGSSYYVELGFWPIGNRDLLVPPGHENPPHVDFSRPDADDPPHAIQLLAKWEQIIASYESASRSGAPDPKNADGAIKVNAFSLGANYWYTKHVRLTVNYVLDMFPGSEPVSASEKGGPVQTSAQRAQAPGNTLAAGTDNAARDGAHVLHELLFRVGISL
jgi:hypothetical protein